MKKSKLLFSAVSLVLILAMCLPLVGCVQDGPPTSIPSVSTPPVQEKNSAVGLPGQEIILAVSNDENAAISIGAVSDLSVMNVMAISNTQVKLQLLKEGEGSFTVTAGNTVTTVSVTCIDLKITNTQEHLDVGEAMDITLSHDVQAAYTVVGAGAEVEGNRLTATGEGAFTLRVTYGDIVLEKKMDSYARGKDILTLDRESPFVRYYGRNTHMGDEVIMNNIGSGFEVTFYGTQLYADLSAWYGAWYGFTQISVLVDGETDTARRVIVLDKATAKTAYPLVTGLDEGVHTVKVLKRTEALSTSMSLHGLHTDGYFKPADKSDKLKLEVYGDSISAGYGNLRPTSNPDFTDAKSQSGLQTYATYAAWALGAEIHVQARSGIGMYTSGNIDDSMQVNTGYAYTTYDQAYAWNFENYTPDVVLINLGTNDYWNPTVFNGDKFVEEYVSFVKKLAEIYGKDTAFVLLSGLMEQEVDAFVRKVQEQLTDSIPNTVLRHQFEKCAYGHPLAQEHLEASEELVKLLKDNGLDKPVQKTPNPDQIPPAGDQKVTLTLTANLADALPSHVTLWVQGLGEKAQLQPVDQLHYRLTAEVAEGDYNISFLLNGEDAYRESGQGSVLQVRAGTTEYTVTPNSFVAMPVDENPHAGTKGWHMSAALFPASFQADSAESVKITNHTNWMAAFVTRRTEYRDNYSVAVNISSAGRVDPANSFIGVIPYYLDDLNYVVCYLEFTSGNTLKSITASGAENGVSIGFHMFDKFAGQKYNGSTKLKVSRCGSKLTVTMNGITQTKVITAMRQENAEIGVWAMHPGDVTYSGLAQAQVTEEQIPEVEKWTISPALFDVSFKEKAGGVISYTNQNWMAGFVMTQAVAGDNYRISMTLKAEVDGFTMADDKFIGALAYYKDQGNFATVYLQWDQQNTLKSIGCTGMIDGKDIGWFDLWGFAGIKTHLTQGETLVIERSGSTITVTYGGMTASVEVPPLAGRLTDYVGLWCCKTTCEYSDFQHSAK